MTPPVLQDFLDHTSALRSLACQLVGEAHADDVVQETAIQTIVAPPRHAGPTEGWLARVVRNLASKQRRSERTRRRHEHEAASAALARDSGQDRGSEDIDTLRALTDVVASLPEPYRATILCRYLRGQSPTEIAAETGTPVATVKTRLQRGLAMLRERLDEQNGDWRALFIGAFAIDPTTLSEPATPMFPPTKLFATVAVVLPVAFFSWFLYPDAEPAEIATAPGERDRTVAAASADVEAASDAKAGQVAAAVPTIGKLSQDPGAEVAPPPPRPVVEIDAVGPAAIRRAFATTNLGILLASTDGEKLWRPLLAPIEAMWQQWDGRGEEFRAARERVLAYAGRIRVLWMFGDGSEGERRPMFGVLALALDDATDPRVLASDLGRPLRRLLPAEPSRKTIGEHDLVVLQDGREVFATMPMLIGDRLVTFFGEPGTERQAVTDGLQALAADVAPPTAPFAVTIDLERMIDATDAADDEVVNALFGLDSLKTLRAEVRPNGRHVEAELAVEWKKGDRGVFAGLLPRADDLPKLRRRLPENANPWWTQPLRLDVMFRSVVEAAGLSEDGGAEGVRAEIRDELKFDIEHELLAHIGEELMVLGDPWDDARRRAFQDGDDLPVAGCVAFSLRDTEQFRAGFDKLLRYFKGFVHRSEVREIDGVKITRIGSAFVTGVHVAVGQGLFAVAVGRDSIAHLETLVRTKGEPADRPLTGAVERVRHLAPEGWNALGVTDLRALLGGQLAIAFESLDNPLARQMGFAVDPDAVQQVFEQLLPLVEQYELGTIVTMAGQHGDWWRGRIVW